VTGFWRAVPDGVRVTVKVQPKSRRPGVQGRGVSAQGACLRIGVSEAAEGGRANWAVCGVLAGMLRVPAGTVAVSLGQTSRDKILHVAGDSDALVRLLEAL
jgi:uncharacterized protein YggU (UPF0235/DUF167 family)